MTNEEKNMISYIFNYCSDNDLFGKIVPRLSLFFKAKFRFDELRKYCRENGFTEEKREPVNNSDIVQKTYRKYYPDKENFAFFKAVERLINRNITKDGKLPEGIFKLFDKAYNDTLS